MSPFANHAWSPKLMDFEHRKLEVRCLPRSGHRDYSRRLHQRLTPSQEYWNQLALAQRRLDPSSRALEVQEIGLLFVQELRRVSKAEQLKQRKITSILPPIRHVNGIPGVLFVAAHFIFPRTIGHGT